MTRSKEVPKGNMKNNRFIWRESWEISTVDNIGHKLGPTYNLHTVRDRTLQSCSAEEAKSEVYEVLMHSLRVGSRKGERLCGLIQTPGWPCAWQVLMSLCMTGEPAHYCVCPFNVLKRLSENVSLSFCSKLNEKNYSECLGHHGMCPLQNQCATQ